MTFNKDEVKPVFYCVLGKQLICTEPMLNHDVHLCNFYCLLQSLDQQYPFLDEGFVIEIKDF